MGTLIVTGLNHRAAAVEIRERLSFSPDRATAALQAFVGKEPLPGITPFLSSEAEVALLSTCNRTEVYLHTEDAPRAERCLRQALVARAGLPSHELNRLLYRLEGEAAAHHLLRVAAGLDSLLMGENEILGQVKAAGELAHEAGTLGPVLAALFRAAARAGKRVRSETEIGRAGLSTAAVVVELAQERFGTLTERQALLVGAGKISSTAAHALVRAGLHCILVANRTFERAQRLAGNLGGAYARAVRFDALQQSLLEADIVICSTGAPHFVLHPAQVEAAMSARPDRPLLIVDLAVPRDVDPAVIDIAGVTLVCLDELEGLVQRRHPLAAVTRQAAEGIVDEELAGFLRWWQDRAAAPIIKALQEKAQSIYRAQVEKSSRQLSELTPQQQQAVEAMGQAMISKLLHDPISFLHDHSSDDKTAEMGVLFREIFGLKEFH